MVAFAPVTTNPREDELRARIVEWRGLLMEIVRQAAENGLPIGKEWPELLAAIRFATMRYPKAILEVMRRRGEPMDAEGIFADLVKSQLLAVKPEMGAVASNISKLAKAGHLVEVQKVGRGQKRWELPGAEAPQPAAEATPRRRVQ